MSMHFPLLKSLTLAITLAIGASYVSAQSTTPPGNNLSVPVHRLSGSQVKDGSLSVNGFLANQNAYFDQDAFLNGIIKGTYTPSDTTSTVRIGNTGRTVGIITTGDVTNTLALGSDTLKNTTSKTVCGSSGGRVVLCDGGTSNQEIVMSCSKSFGENPQDPGRFNDIYHLSFSKEVNTSLKVVVCDGSIIVSGLCNNLNGHEIFVPQNQMPLSLEVGSSSGDSTCGVGSVTPSQVPGYTFTY